MAKYRYGCDNKACEAFLDATGAPDCDDPNSEQCQKDNYEWAVRNTCAVATFGAGEVLPICADGAKVLAKLTWPIVKYFMMPFGEAMGNAIMALIPNAWKAQGVFSGETQVSIWYWGHTTFDPSTDVLTGFVVPWREAIAAVDQAWRASCEMFDLDPNTPFQVRSDLLRPAIPASRLDNHPEAKIMHAGNVLQPDGTVPPFVSNAEQALVLWMDRYYLGTRTIRALWPEEGPVLNSRLPGTLDQTELFENRPGNTGRRSRGPMGIEYQGYDNEDCGSDCVKRFGQAVASCWGYRLEALKAALPEVVGVTMGAAAELAQQQQAITDWSSFRIRVPNNTNLRMRGQQESGSSTLGWLLVLGLLGAGGYGLWRVLKK